MKLPRMFFPPKFQDPEGDRQSKLFHGFLWFALLIATAFAGAISILLPSSLVRAIIILCFVGLAASICFPLIYRGRTRRASYIFVFLFWSTITVLSATGGGTAAPAFVGYMVVTLSAGLLLGLTPAIITGVLCITTEVVLAYAEAHALLPTGVVQQTVHTRLIAHILFFAFVAAIVYFYSKEIESSGFPSSSASDDTVTAPRKLPTVLVTIFVIFSVGIITAGYFYAGYQRDEFARSAEEDLIDIARLEVTQVEDWRRERIGDAQVLCENSSFSDILQRYLRRPSDNTVRNDLERWLESVRKNYGYSAIVCFDRKRTPMLQTGDFHADKEPGGFKAMFDSVSRSGKLLFSDLHRIDGGNQFRLDLVGPVFDRSGKTLLGLMVLQIDPSRHLFPLVQNWSAQSRTFESELFQQEGNDIVSVSALRFRDKDSAAWRLPVSALGASGSRVSSESQGIIRIVDYRGVLVFAAMEKMRSFPWHVVIKGDEAEIYEPLRRNEWDIGLLIVFLILGAGGAVGFLWQSNSTSFYRRQYQLEAERRVLAQQFDNLRKNANDIVMLLDDQNRVVEANDRAVSAYGYSLQELVGIDARVLRSPHEVDTFKRDIEKADAVKGAVFETVHRRKDGTTFPVEISSRSIEIEGKKFQQGIIRDITERKQAAKEIERLNRVYAVLSKTNEAIVRIADRQKLFEKICQVAVETGGFRLAWVGVLEGTNVNVAAYSGHSDGYVEQLQITIDEGDPLGRGPTGTAIREGRTVIVQNVEHNDLIAPWREDAVRRGYHSSIMIPLRVFHKMWGSIQFYSSDPFFFDDQEVRLLEELANDVAFAVESMKREEQRKEAEELFRQSEEEFRVMFEGAAIGSALVDLEGKPIRSNPALCRMLGYSEAELTRMAFTEFTHPEDAPKDLQLYQSMFKGEIDHYQIEKRYIHKDGHIVWGFLTVSLVRAQDESPRFAVGMVEDITEGKRAEEALHASMEQLHALARRLENVREEERKSISQELHDQLGQILTAIYMDMMVIKKNASINEKLISENLNSALALVDNAVSIVQDVSAKLRPRMLDDLGLLAAMEWQLEDFEKHSGIRCLIRVPEQEPAIDSERATAVFRILQETLTNIARHAKAKKIEVRLLESASEITMSITDDGVGITQEQVDDPKSLGLLGMRERLIPFDGICTFQKGPEGGTEVLIRVPKKGDLRP